MYEYACTGFGIQNAGWNHNWMFPGPMFGAMCCGPMRFGGYNPRVSDNVMIGHTVLSGIDGIIAGLDAHFNKGLNGLDSARVAVGTATVGTHNALLGNIIDRNTGTYFGSIANSTLSTFTNPFAANMELTAGAIMTSPFINPFARPFGMPFGGPFGVGFGFYC